MDSCRGISPSRVSPGPQSVPKVPTRSLLEAPLTLPGSPRGDLQGDVGLVEGKPPSLYPCRAITQFVPGPTRRSLPSPSLPPRPVPSGTRRRGGGTTTGASTAGEVGVCPASASTGGGPVRATCPPPPNLPSPPRAVGLAPRRLVLPGAPCVRRPRCRSSGRARSQMFHPTRGGRPADTHA